MAGESEGEEEEQGDPSSVLLLPVRVGSLKVTSHNHWEGEQPLPFTPESMYEKYGLI